MHASLAYRLTHMEDTNRELVKKVAALEQKLLSPAHQPVVVQDTAVIKLNVGGKLFYTRASTLQTVASSFLANLVSGRFPRALSNGDEIFLDRDPEYFDVILNWLRSPCAHTLTAHITSPQFINELEYFGLTQAMLGDTKLMVFGGQAANVQTAQGQSVELTLQTMHVYYPQLQLWTTSSTLMPEARRRFAIAVLHERVYLIGGHNGHRQQSTVLCYEPATDAWTSLLPMPETCTQMSAVASESFIYCVGGYSINAPVGKGFRFCPKTNSWTSVPELGVPRLSHASLYMAPFLYVVGGWNATEHFRSMERFDTRHPEKGWVLMTPMLEQRSEVAAVVYKNKIYAIGGYDGQDFLRSVEVYDPVSDTWSKLSPMITPRAWPAVTVLDNKIVVAGGRLRPGCMLNNVEIYDPAADTWQVGPAMPIARDGHGMVCANI